MSRSIECDLVQSLDIESHSWRLGAQTAVGPARAAFHTERPNHRTTRANGHPVGRLDVCRFVPLSPLKRIWTVPKGDDA
jgi:hypothetical protein